MLLEQPKSFKILLAYPLVKGTLFHLKRKRYYLESRCHNLRNFKEFKELRNLKLLVKQQMSTEDTPFLIFLLRAKARYFK